MLKQVERDLTKSAIFAIIIIKELSNIRLILCKWHSTDLTGFVNVRCHTEVAIKPRSKVSGRSKSWNTCIADCKLAYLYVVQLSTCTNHNEFRLVLIKFQLIYCYPSSNLLNTILNIINSIQSGLNDRYNCVSSV